MSFFINKTYEIFRVSEIILNLIYCCECRKNWKKFWGLKFSTRGPVQLRNHGSISQLVVKINTTKGKKFIRLFAGNK